MKFLDFFFFETFCICELYYFKKRNQNKNLLQSKAILCEDIDY